MNTFWDGFSMGEYFILLLAGHIFADFLLQFDWMAKRKKEGGVLFLHCLIHALIGYFILVKWEIWYLPIVLLVLHGIIDGITCRLKRTLGIFILDQGLHLASLLGVAFVCHYYAGGSVPWINQSLREVIIVSAGLVATVKGVGVIVGRISEQIIRDNPHSVKVGDDEVTLAGILSRGLVNGGKQIGNLERALIFIFVLMGQYAAIGFLVAAKSAFRFEESKKQMVGEYVLIGTIWSMGLALCVSYGTKLLLEM